MIDTIREQKWNVKTRIISPCRCHWTGRLWYLNGTDWTSIQGCRWHQQVVHGRQQNDEEIMEGTHLCQVSSYRDKDIELHIVQTPGGGFNGLRSRHGVIIKAGFQSQKNNNCDSKIRPRTDVEISQTWTDGQTKLEFKSESDSLVTMERLCFRLSNGETWQS